MSEKIFVALGSKMWKLSYIDSIDGVFESKYFGEDIVVRGAGAWYKTSAVVEGDVNEEPEFEKLAPWELEKFLLGEDYVPDTSWEDECFEMNSHYVNDDIYAGF